MAEGDGPEAEDRTEAPTQRRIEKAREEGQVPLSREAVGFATLLAGTLACALALPGLGRGWMLAMRDLLAAPEMASAGPVLRASGLVALVVLLAVSAAALLATLPQTGFLLHGEAVLPQARRLSPRAALSRILGVEGLVELLRTLLKLGVLGAALWWAAEPAMLLAAVHHPAGLLLAEAARAALSLAAAALAAFAGVAVLDLLWVRLRHTRQLRMSRQDLKEEMREAEGDPAVKARLRRLREQRARRRMLAAVKEATAVVTNPTHYAVAIRYDSGDSAAPRLVAKGVDEMAARIRQAAEEAGVPIVANPPLARALFRVEPDTEIPMEHWQAVAEVIAYVWRLQGRRAGG